MQNKSSFIYGENPSSVPIYAVVSMCSSDKDFNFKNGNAWNENDCFLISIFLKLIYST